MTAPVKTSSTSAAGRPLLWLNRHNHRAGAVFLLLLCVLVLTQVWDLEFGTLSRPGPGLWPTVVAVITAVLALAEAIFARRDEEPFTPAGTARVGGLVLLLIAFPVLYELAGFMIPSALVVLVMMRFLSKQRWLLSVSVAVGTAVVCYWLFAELLQVRLDAI